MNEQFIYRGLNVEIPIEHLQVRQTNGAIVTDADGKHVADFGDVPGAKLFIEANSKREYISTNGVRHETPALIPGLRLEICKPAPAKPRRYPLIEPESPTPGEPVISQTVIDAIVRNNYNPA